MARLPRDKEREQLEQEIEGEEYHLLLVRLHGEHPFLTDFSTWGQVVGFMRDGSSQDPLKDEVLRPILAAHAADGDPRWRTILLVIFWPGLRSICIKRRRWDKEFEELWANAVWIFLEAVCRLDVTKRPNRLVQKLVNDTTWRIGVEYRQARDRASLEIPTDPELVECLAGGCEDAGLVNQYVEEEREFRLCHFRKHLKAGRMNETDFNLIVETRVYEKPLRECAEEWGLSYQAAKKRRQRAEAAVRHCEESS